MLKLLKYLKNDFPKIILIIILLVAQAYLDLSLPEYTSDIVNVGIQQKGIQDGVYETLSDTTLDKMLLLTDKDELLLDSYTVITSLGDYLEEYPLLLEEDIYLLNENYSEEARDVIYETGILSYLLATEGEMTDGIFEALSTSLNMEVNSENIFTILSILTEEQLSEIVTPLAEMLNEYPESILEQLAISTVQVEYEKIGIDIDSIQTQYILIAGAKMVCISLLIMADALLILFVGARMAAKLAKTLREKVFKNVLEFSEKEVKKFGTASLITRTTNDIQQVQQVIIMMFRVVFYAPIIAIGGIIKSTQSDSSMLFIIIGAVGTLMFVITLLFTFVMPKFSKLQKLIDKLNLVSREILTGIPVIRAFSNEKHEEQRFEEANKNLTKTNLFINRTMSCMMPIMLLIMNLTTVAILWYGSVGVDAGTIQVGDMMAYIQYAMQIIMSFLMIAIISIILPRASVSAKRILEVINTDSSIKNKEKTKKLKSKIKTLEFDNVSFRYPEAQEDVITNINFKTSAGMTTAFIGSTGSGKSTLINLIPRFYDVTKGSIKINDINILDLEMKQLREKIGYVPQKGILFSGSVLSNIKYGDDTLNNKSVVEASKIAQADNFVSKLENQYSFDIAQGGTNVSGGQRQRLSIARAIAIDPDIYIFDDSFSALDFKTDATLRKELGKITKDKIMLIVAQRVSTIMNADQIVVLNDGIIEGIGTHKELLKTCKVYKEIASSQLSQEELDNE
ncbi:MAG: ABC transporter ATP-binding protein [Mycoplasmatota bacterium]